MGPNNFESQIYNMQNSQPNFQSNDTSGTPQPNGIGTANTILNFAALAYNILNNERNVGINEELNRQAQSNFVNQYQIMSRDLQASGFNPSSLVGGAQNTTPPSFLPGNGQQIDTSAISNLLDSITNARVADSTIKLNEANAEKSSAEAGNEVNKYSHEEYMFNLNRWHELDKQSKEYTLKTNLQKYIQDFEKTENKKDRENALDAIYAKANYDNQLQNRLYDLKNQLNINDAKLREVLLDKEVEYKILTMQIQGNIDKDKLTMELAQRFKELGVEMSERAYETLSHSLDNLASCVSNIFGASIISGGSAPSKVIIPPSKFNKWD